MIFHRAIERIRAMPAGSAAAWELLLHALSKTNDLHSKDAKHHFEATHNQQASDEHAVLTIEQHQVGPGEEEWAPEAGLNERGQKSWAFNVKKGNSHFGRDQLTERYNYGALRPATASGASVEDDPSYVPVVDDELGAEFDVYMQVYQRYEDGDRVLYGLDKSGKAWTFGGGQGGVLRKALTTAIWQDGSPNPTVAATDVESGEAITIQLPRTMPGDPNVRSGATLYYMRANDGLLICLTDYMDDKIGTMKVFNADGDSPVAGWLHHEPSAGKVVPNYLEGDPDYPTTGTTGGNKEHDHDPHTITTATIDVVTDVTFDSETCDVTPTTQQICFVGQAVT